MSQRVTLEPPTAAVEAGADAVVDLTIRNVGDVVEEYHVEVVGDPALWCVVEPSAIRLYPGTTGTVRLTFSPPRAAESAAGPHPYGVRVTALEDPAAVTVPEGILTVAPFVDVRAELLPPTIRGWRHAKPRLVVSNYGNSLATTSVSAASGSGDQLDFDIRTPSVQVQPGRAHFSVLRLRPERLLWLGREATHRYTVTWHLSGREPITASGTYRQSALLPRWLARVFAGVTALTTAFVVLWFAARPSVTSDATAQTAVTGAPTVQDSPPTGFPPPPSQRPSAPASAPTAAVSNPPAEPSSPGGAPQPSTKPPAPTPTPVAAWMLNQTGGTTAVDSEGVHPGQVYSGWFTDAACLFNGSTTQITTNGPVLNTGPGSSFTVFADVWLDQTTSTLEQTMVSQDGSQDSGFYLQYMGNGTSSTSGYWAFSRLGSDTAAPSPYRAYSTTKAPTKTWTRLAGVFNAATNQLQIYVNGQLQGTATDPTPYGTGGNLAMGRAQYDGKPSDYFRGALSNVEVFDHALDAAQINAISVSQHNS